MASNKTFQYNGALLKKERTRQKIARSDIAQQLTMHEGQIKSIEEHLPHGFANDHFRTLAIKRYAFILALPIEKVIPPDAPRNLEPSIVDDIQQISLNKFVLPLCAFLTLIIIVFFIVVNNSSHDDLELPASSDEAINLPASDASELTQNDLPIVLEVPGQAGDPTDIIEKKEVPEVATPNAQALSFICTIRTASPFTHFSTNSPEKPATYFHLISTKAQTICTLDNNDTLATYTLSEGEKLTHRGVAPFKIQLDPTRSELYFEGWKVHLQNQDIFIKLNPAPTN
jgi:hypothetical protein